MRWLLTFVHGISSNIFRYSISDSSLVLAVEDETWLAKVQSSPLWLRDSQLSTDLRQVPQSRRVLWRLRVL